MKGVCDSKQAGFEEGDEVCVECQAVAMGKEWGCVGVGREGVESRWKVFGTHNCHGKWRQKGQAKKCACAKAFIFV